MTLDKTIVSTRNAPAAIGPYSQAVRSGEWLFVSGQIPLDPETGVLVSGGMREQTERALRNLGGILGESGLDFKHVVKTTVFLRDMSKFSDMNEVYARYFGDCAPARATVEVSGLPKGAWVEIEAIARCARGLSG